MLNLQSCADRSSCKNSSLSGMLIRCIYPSVVSDVSSASLPLLASQTQLHTGPADIPTLGGGGGRIVVVVVVVMMMVVVVVMVVVMVVVVDSSGGGRIVVVMVMVMVVVVVEDG